MKRELSFINVEEGHCNQFASKKKAIEYATIDTLNKFVKEV